MQIWFLCNFFSGKQTQQNLYLHFQHNRASKKHLKSMVFMSQRLKKEKRAFIYCTCFFSSSLTSWHSRTTSASGSRRRAWWECPVKQVSNFALAGQEGKSGDSAAHYTSNVTAWIGHVSPNSESSRKMCRTSDSTCNSALCTCHHIIWLGEFGSSGEMLHLLSSAQQQFKRCSRVLDFRWRQIITYLPNDVGKNSK